MFFHSQGKFQHNVTVIFPSVRSRYLFDMCFCWGGGRKGKGSKTKVMDTANSVLYKKYPVHWYTRSAYLQSKKKKKKNGVVVALPNILGFPGVEMFSYF